MGQGQYGFGAGAPSNAQHHNAQLQQQQRAYMEGLQGGQGSAHGTSNYSDARRAPYGSYTSHPYPPPRR